MTYFQGLCHGNCALGYVERILQLRKLDFRGLKGQFDVKKANFRGLFAEIDYLRTTFHSRIPVWPIFMIYVMEIVP